MTQSEILLEKEKAYLKMEEAQARLCEIRKICKHPETFEGNYSWRPGAMQLADICTDCGELVKYK